VYVDVGYIADFVKGK